MRKSLNNVQIRNDSFKGDRTIGKIAKLMERPNIVMEGAETVNSIAESDRKNIV